MIPRTETDIISEQIEKFVSRRPFPAPKVFVAINFDHRVAILRQQSNKGNETGFREPRVADVIGDPLINKAFVEEAVAIGKEHENEVMLVDLTGQGVVYLAPIGSDSWALQPNGAVPQKEPIAQHVRERRLGQFVGGQFSKIMHRGQEINLKPH